MDARESDIPVSRKREGSFSGGRRAEEARDVLILRVEI